MNDELNALAKRIEESIIRYYEREDMFQPEIDKLNYLARKLALHIAEKIIRQREKREIRRRREEYFHNP